MTVAYEGHGVTVHIADALDVLAGIADASVDAVVTDPPYGLEFMGKEWDAPWKSAANSWADRDAEDHAQPENRGQTASPFLAAKVNKFAAGLPFQQWCELWAGECLRVLKPGGRFYLSTAPTLSLAGAHLPRLRVPVPIHLFLGRKLAFRAFVFLAARAPWMLSERASANTFVQLAESGREKEDDLLTPVTLRGMARWIAGSPFRQISEQTYVTGFFKRTIPAFLRPTLLKIPVVGDVMVSQIECVLEKS